MGTFTVGLRKTSSPLGPLKQTKLMQKMEVVIYEN